MTRPGRPRRARAATAIALAGVLALALALAGCAPKPSLVGTWEAPITSGKPGQLSTLMLNADGTFRYGGKNALGGPVAFGGTYKLGSADGAPTVTLDYADYPGRPITWFYSLTSDKLAVSTVRADLTNGTALTFERAK